MTDSSHNVSRSDIDAIYGRIREIERRQDEEIRRMSDRLVRAETRQKSGLKRLEALERDAKRLWLIGWGVAFSAIAWLLGAVRGVMF